MTPGHLLAEALCAARGGDSLTDADLTAGEALAERVRPVAWRDALAHFRQVSPQGGAVDAAADALRTLIADTPGGADALPVEQLASVALLAAEPVLRDRAARLVERTAPVAVFALSGPPAVFCVDRAATAAAIREGGQ